jgi:hypothetical protein
MDQIARCSKPPKAGEYTKENRYLDEDFTPAKFFQTEESKLCALRLSDLFRDPFLYN